MTMTISAADFKTRCLALLDDVAAGGAELIVTKRGRPVARVVPIDDDAAMLRRSVTYSREADLLEPTEEPWDAER